MSDIAETAGANFDRDDIELVKLFLTEYKDEDGNPYHLKERPDKVEREAEAVDAVAVDRQGHSLAIEHTMLEAFAGKRTDDVPFLTAFEHLRLDESLRLPNRLINGLCAGIWQRGRLTGFSAIGVSR
jgi:hypothetical protein